jgi:hypothetical protein
MADDPVACSAARHAAVGRGLDFIYAHLSEDAPRRALLLGEQCVSMFYDVWLSDADDTLCEVARQRALSLLATLEEHYLAHWPLPWDTRQLLEVLCLVRFEPLGHDLSRLLALADEAVGGSVDMRHLTLSAAQHADWQAGQLSSADWFDVMSKAFAYEVAALAHPRRFEPAPRVGMRQVLTGLRRHVLEAPCQPTATSDFGEAFYLAAHAAFWLSAHAPTLDLLREAPWLVAFLQRALAFWLSQAPLRHAPTLAPTLTPSTSTSSCPSSSSARSP